jgi:hypothetical protein
LEEGPTSGKAEALGLDGIPRRHFNGPGLLISITTPPRARDCAGDYAKVKK